MIPRLVTKILPCDFFCDGAGAVAVAGIGYSSGLMIITWVCRHHGRTQVGDQTHVPANEPSQAHVFLYIRPKSFKHLIC